MIFITIPAWILALAYPITSQQITDIRQTTWDGAYLFANITPPYQMNFGSSTTTTKADILVDGSTIYQPVVGFGATLTDSSATILSNLKATNPNNYWSLLITLFNPADGQPTAGLSYLRVPIGASDFSASAYTYVEELNVDPTLSSFNISKTPANVWSTLQDIQQINDLLKVHIIAWSPPGWMKDTNTTNGGHFLSPFASIYANYLLLVLQGFVTKGVSVYAISIQNEPESTNDSLPSCIFTPDQEASVAIILRVLMNNNGLADVRIIGYDHNWDDAGGYPVQIMEDEQNAYAGVSFHCYIGNVTQQAEFSSRFPDKEIYFTECSGVFGSDWWSDIKFYMDNLMIGSVQYGSRSVLMWNLALDGKGMPKLPGATSCGTPCRPIVTVNSDGSYFLNQEYYAMAQASRAVTPCDVGGPWGHRIGVDVTGTLNWALRVGAYVTGRANSSDLKRYSLVVLNWYDNASNGTRAATPVQTNIHFGGVQAIYTFPVGVTTLSWYAP